MDEYLDEYLIGVASGLDLLTLQFLVLFRQAIHDNDLPAITSMYEQGWNKLTQVSPSDKRVSLVTGLTCLGALLR